MSFPGQPQLFGVNERVYSTAPANWASEGSSNAGALGNAEYPFIAITPKSTLAPDKSPIYGLNKTKLCTYTLLNCLK